MKVVFTLGCKLAAYLEGKEARDTGKKPYELVVPEYIEKHEELLRHYFTGYEGEDFIDYSEKFDS